MGLGKTFTTLAAIVSTLDRASEFAARSKTPAIASRATLVVVPSERKQHETRTLLNVIQKADNPIKFSLTHGQTKSNGMYFFATQKSRGAADRLLSKAFLPQVSPLRQISCLGETRSCRHNQPARCSSHNLWHNHGGSPWRQQHYPQDQLVPAGSG